MARRSLARLRLRLTLWYGGVFTLILVLLGGGFFLAVRQQISRQLDASLRAATAALQRAARIREIERAHATGTGDGRGGRAAHSRPGPLSVRRGWRADHSARRRRLGPGGGAAGDSARRVDLDFDVPGGQESVCTPSASPAARARRTSPPPPPIASSSKTATPP